MDKDVEEYQKSKTEELLEWCREYSRKQIEQIERELGVRNEKSK